MADDAKQPVPDHLNADDPSLPDEASDWVDVWLQENGEALERSLVEVRASLDRGEYSKRLIADVVADGRKRHAG